MRFIAKLPREAIARATEQTHALWGEGRSLADYTAHVYQQLDRSAERMHYAGLVEAGEVVCSVKAYDLRLATPTSAVAAIGIGAVFTPAPHRKRGLAAHLLQQVLNGAGERGRRAALLFSDIDPIYYERAGFRRTLATTSWAELADLPAHDVNVARHQGGELPSIEPLPGIVSLRHDPVSLRYWLWRAGGPDVWVGDDGCAITSTRDDVLWVHHVEGCEGVQLQRVVATLARRCGVSRVAGWLRDAGTPFREQLRRTCIPMLAPLGSNPPTLEPAHFSSLDAF